MMSDRRPGALSITESAHYFVNNLAIIKENYFEHLARFCCFFKHLAHQEP